MKSGPKVPWTDVELRAAVATSRSWRQVALSLNTATTGNSWRAIRKRAEELQLNSDHFTGRGSNKGQGNGRDMEKQRAAKRRWYENNRQVYLDRNRRRREQMREVYRQAKSVPCFDCGVSYPYFVMDLDHREGVEKLANVSKLALSNNLKRLKEEMQKCDVVCSNCHRFRTMRRLGWTE